VDVLQIMARTNPNRTLSKIETWRETAPQHFGVRRSPVVSGGCQVRRHSGPLDRGSLNVPFRQQLSSRRRLWAATR